jgi:hypothetical protein
MNSRKLSLVLPNNTAKSKLSNESVTMATGGGDGDGDDDAGRLIEASRQHADVKMCHQLMSDIRIIACKACKACMACIACILSW